MKTNELRLGNLVQFSLVITKGIYEVSAIRSNQIGVIGLTFEYKISEFQPIPLTEEWLVRFGFQKREGSTSNEWWNGINEVTKDWLVDITQMNDDGTFFYRNGKHVINYVHELQNLHFVLAGEELKLANKETRLPFPDDESLMQKAK